MGVGPCHALASPRAAGIRLRQKAMRNHGRRRSTNNSRDDRGSPQHGTTESLSRRTAERVAPARPAPAGRDARGREDKYRDYLFFLAYVSTARKCRRNLAPSRAPFSRSMPANLSGIESRRAGERGDRTRNRRRIMSHRYKKIR